MSSPIAIWKVVLYLKCDNLILNVTQVTGDICGKGTFCIVGSSKEEDCPRGTFNSETGYQPDTFTCLKSNSIS